MSCLVYLEPMNNESMKKLTGAVLLIPAAILACAGGADATVLAVLAILPAALGLYFLRSKGDRWWPDERG